MYPHEAPKVKSETKIYHPNIDLQGNVTLALSSSAHRRVTQFFLQCFVEKERYFSSKLFFSHYIYYIHCTRRCLSRRLVEISPVTFEI